MRYQDLVIKDGKFVGEFEKMYQMFDNPWHQLDEGYVKNSISRQVVCNYIKIFNIKSIVEFGCGLGKTSDFIFQKTQLNILGIDISETSIEKAKTYYPHLQFKADNVKSIAEYKNYECIFFSEITWYLLEDKLLDRVFEKMKTEMSGKYFIHNLVFYKGQQKYGTNYFTCLDEFVKFCPFTLVGKVEIDLRKSDTVETSSIFVI